MDLFLLKRLNIIYYMKIEQRCTRKSTKRIKNIIAYRIINMF